MLMQFSFTMLRFAIGTCCAVFVWLPVQGQFLTYNKSYGGPALEVGLGMVHAPNGGVMVVGFTGSYGQNAGDQTPNAHVMRVDSVGQVLWRRSFGGPAYDFLEDVTVLPNGEYLAVGNYNYGGNPGSGQVLLTRIQDNGTVVWNKRLGSGTRNEYANLVLALENGDCVIAGSRLFFGGGTDGNVLVVKVNMVGEPIWTAEIGSDRQDDPKALVQTADGGFLIAGARFDFPYAQGFLLKIGPDGNLDWHRTFQAPGQGISFSRLAPAGNDQFVGILGGALVGVDAEGNILWERGYAYPAGDSFGIADLVPAGNGHFLAVGGAYSQDYTVSALTALVVDGTGELVGTMQYNLGLANAYGRGGLYHEDGSFTLMGDLLVQGGDINLVRTWGMVPGLEAGCYTHELVLEPVDAPKLSVLFQYEQLPSPVLVVNTMSLAVNASGNETTHCANVGVHPVAEVPALGLFPVPASDILILEGLPDGPLFVELYDAAGRRILEHDSMIERSLDVRALPQGAYLCHVVLGEGTRMVARFLVGR